MSDSKQKVRAAELMAQLKGDRYEERSAEVRHLAERGNELNMNLYKTLSPTRRHKTRKASWVPNSDSESEDSRLDNAYLTPDGKEVVEQQYKLMNGHWASLTYRKQLHEVDPGLLAALRQKREKEQAKWKAKQEKKKAKGSKGEQQDGMPRISTPLAQLTDMGAPRSTHRTHREKGVGKSTYSGNSRERSRGEQQDRVPLPSNHAVYDAECQREVNRWRQVSSTETKKALPWEEKTPSSPPSTPPEILSSSPTSFLSPDSFRMRAERSGFHPSGEYDTRHTVDNEDHLDIWEQIADEECSNTKWRKAK
ncbi:hypothetical protein GGR55DRAFT_640908 [Xylaria sp. FL0064]|nr:hypothetical protein GGR55DRAFT_640908 [Xylaria sp. FL0064]